MHIHTYAAACICACIYMSMPRHAYVHEFACICDPLPGRDQPGLKMETQPIGGGGPRDLGPDAYIFIYTYIYMCYTYVYV